MERIILGAIFAAAVIAAALMLRRSYVRTRSGGACAGCPMAGECRGSAAPHGTKGGEAEA